jgi:hypothetical protein
MTLTEQLALGDVHGKADLILEDARHALRLDIANAEQPIVSAANGEQTQETIPIAESEHYQALVDRNLKNSRHNLITRWRVRRMSWQRAAAKGWYIKARQIMPGRISIRQNG